MDRRINFRYVRTPSQLNCLALRYLMGLVGGYDAFAKLIREAYLSGQITQRYEEGMIRAIRKAARYVPGDDTVKDGQEVEGIGKVSLRKFYRERRRLLIEDEKKREEHNRKYRWKGKRKI